MKQRFVDLTMYSKPTYFQMPNFETPPDSLVQLGQLIHDFRDPTWRVAPPPVGAFVQDILTVHSHVQTDWTATRTKLRQGRIGVFPHFLASILFSGGGADANAALLLDKQMSETLKFERLETSFIEPCLEYVQAAMASREAVQYFSENPGATVFMVTGIKIARGAAVEHMRKVKYGVQGGLGSTIGPQAEYSSESTVESSAGGVGDFVFAYRLREVVRKRSKGVVGTKEYVRGAVHSVEEEGADFVNEIPSIDSSTEADFEVVGLQGGDFGPELVYDEFTLVGVDDDDEQSTPAQVLVQQ